MVHVRTVNGAFHARVIAARLGADGIITELRGNVGSVYPFGQVSVWVSSEDAEAAAELLLADEVEAAFTPHPDDEEPRPRSRVLWGMDRRQLVAAASLVVLLFTAVAGRLLGG
jgi:pyruvate/2-oxoglutarate dehydrogenase complex dihydrolipoamide acyltransferase (E2) component